MQACALVVAEEKELVWNDRSAKRPAKNILRIRVLFIAIVVGFVVYSILSAVFSMTQSLQFRVR